MPLNAGEIFAGFRIIRLLGSGGMGEVYLAQHPRLPRRNALKVLPADLSADAEYRARFNREADLASTLWHPHIVSVHDRGEYQGQLWISMDYVDGQDAASLIQNRCPAGMPAPEVATVIAAIASALDYAHQRGLLHRDVKPANILLAKPERGEQRILLTDFGIARNIGEARGLTATDAIMGTLYYSAPEQLKGKALDGRVDQYALAVTAYHLLTGSVPFEHSNPAVVIGHHLTSSPPSLSQSHPELAALDPVLTIALSKHPDNRFPKCIDFARALTLTRPTSPFQTTHSANISRDTTDVSDPKPRWPITAGAIVVILLLCAVAFAVRPWQQDRNGTTSTPTSVTPSITFDGMRDFVTGYYNDLPTHPYDAWAKVDSASHNQTGLQKFLDFWATIQSVTLISVSPRDATSVVARLRYVRRDGQSDTEDRWFRMALVNGALLLDESERVGSVPTTESTIEPAPPSASGPFLASAIDSVLLTPSEITNITGGKFKGYPNGPVELINSSLGTSDNTHAIDPPECAGVIFGADQRVYADTGYEAIRDRTLGNTVSDIDDLVEQTAVVFSTADQAQAVLTSSTAQWRQCAGGHPAPDPRYPAGSPAAAPPEYSIGQDAGYERGWGWYLTNVVVGDGLITLRMSAVDNLNGNAPACQLALGVRDNVVVKAKTCVDTRTGPSRPDPSLAGDYAERLTTAMLDRVQV